MLLDFKEIIIIQNFFDDLPYIIGLIRVIRHHKVELITPSVRRISRLFERRIFQVVIGNKREKFTDQFHRVFFVLGRKMRHTANAVVSLCPS